MSHQTYFPEISVHQVITDTMKDTSWGNDEFPSFMLHDHFVHNEAEQFPKLYVDGKTFHVQNSEQCFYSGSNLSLAMAMIRSFTLENGIAEHLLTLAMVADIVLDTDFSNASKCAESLERIAYLAA